LGCTLPVYGKQSRCLAAHPNSSNAFYSGFAIGKDLFQRMADGTPPIFGILLRPVWMGVLGGVFLAGLSQQEAIAVH
jgi:hypothetical protein